MLARSELSCRFRRGEALICQRFVISFVDPVYQPESVMSRHRCFPVVLAWVLIPLGCAASHWCSHAWAADAEPPEGFRVLFNGRDLSGWYGLNPHQAAKLSGQERQQNLQRQREEFTEYWTVEDGELVNDGRGPYATTEEEFGDIELLVEYKTVAGADSGIYLRGTPQVQIWDWNQPYNPERPTRRPHLGSGGLFNNTPGAQGRDPLALADRPFGQWNEFRIRQVGDLTWVWLNDQLVVDGAVMENFWDREQQLPERGPIMLQTHGGEIRWRNIFVRQIDSEEAAEIVRQNETELKASLRQALTLHAPFDDGLDAALAKGDQQCYFVDAGQLLPAVPGEDLKLVPEGRFGGALRFVRKGSQRPTFQDGGTLGYNDRSWNASVSVWLRLDPDEDLEPGYCDPVQIVAGDTSQGFIFLEWSKDHEPRKFRYAIRPLQRIWNPQNLGWEEIPARERPMVEVDEAPFSRDHWTHAVFTLENINHADGPSSGRLYLNGQLQGTIDNWDLTFGWEAERVRLVLGAAYVGDLDDLAVFNTALTDRQVRLLYGLQEGVADLR